MNAEERLNNMRNIIIGTVPRYEMSATLKQLLGGDIIVYRNINQEFETMSDEERLNKIREIINDDTPINLR